MLAQRYGQAFINTIYPKSGAESATIFYQENREQAHAYIEAFLVNK